MQNTYKVLLAPTAELATPYHMKVEATVEAEYGNYVVEGKLITLAHHVKKYRHMQAPCNREIDVQLPSNSTILISHLDLDTIGGVMALLNKKPNNKLFWEAAEYIDIKGPHHLKKKYPELESKFNAYWSWACKQSKPHCKSKVTDVTHLINNSIEAIHKILNDDEGLLSEGERWKFFTKVKVENCLALENKYFRVFITDDVSCSSSYYSEKQGKIIPYTLTFNTKNGNIILGCFDNGEQIDARNFVRTLWGEGAGGQKGIAGSPRGKKMQLNDLNEAINYLKRALHKQKIQY